MRNDMMTDWDVKKAYQETVKPIFFPVIFIDRYWDYYMKLFGQEKKYKEFREMFKSGGFTYCSYMDEYNDITYRCAEKQLTENQSTVHNMINSYVDRNITGNTGNLFPKLNSYDFPDGRYLQVDLHNAFDEALKNVGVFNPDYESTDEIIDDVSKYDIFKNMKKLRLSVYAYNNFTQMKELFCICSDEILKKVYLSEDDLMKHLRERYHKGVRSSGDMYMYEIGYDCVDEITGDHMIDGISVNMSVVEIKTVYLFGNRCKIQFIPGSSLTDYVLGWSRHNILPPELSPLLLRIGRNEEPTKMDFAIGNEDKIYFHLNKNDYKI